MTKHGFEGDEIFMPTDLSTQDLENFGVLARGLLGQECQGYMGPNSKGEAEVANDYDKTEYIKPRTDESYCMDDRFEGYGVQLPGNRAISELAGDYMDVSVPAHTLSRAAARKVNELVAIGRTPVFHGDENSGKKGCAANLYLRAALTYNGDHPAQVAAMASDRLRMLGIDTVSKDDLVAMIEAGNHRASDDMLWDIDAEGVIDIAQEIGVPYIVFKGAHHTAGPREDMSPFTFDNGNFRADPNHRTDDDHPMGALSLTYGAYVEQLREDGFSEDDVIKKATGVVLFSVAMLKLANKDEAIDVIVGDGVVN